LKELEELEEMGIEEELRATPAQVPTTYKTMQPQEPAYNLPTVPVGVSQPHQPKQQQVESDEERVLRELKDTMLGA